MPDSSTNLGVRVCEFTSIATSITSTKFECDGEKTALEKGLHSYEAASQAAREVTSLRDDLQETSTANTEDSQMNPKDLTLAELQAHPLIGQMTKDIQETRAQKEQQRIIDEGERARLRAEQGRIAYEAVQTEVARYEVLRTPAHEQLGRVWAAEQNYHRITGRESGVFAQPTFLQINLSTLDPKAQWACGMSTTYVSVQAFMASGGKTWV